MELVVTKHRDSKSGNALFKAVTDGSRVKVRIKAIRVEPDGNETIYYKTEVNAAYPNKYSLDSGGDEPIESLSFDTYETSITVPDEQPAEKA